MSFSFVATLVDVTGLVIYFSVAAVLLMGGRIDQGRAVVIGATGSILIGTALDELERSGGRYGLVTMCAAGGMAPAIIIERV